MPLFKITTEIFSKISFVCFIVHDAFGFDISLIIVRIFVAVDHVRFALRASWGVSLSATHPPNSAKELRLWTWTSSAQSS